MVQPSRLNSYALALIFVVVMHYSMESVAFHDYAVYTKGKKVDVWPTFFLGGEILPGDYERFEKIISERGEFPSLVSLQTSPGGNLEEAMKIGRLLRQSLTRVMLEDGRNCFSACFFILVGSPDRLIYGGTIGLHRPYYNRASFGKLDLSKAERRYAELDGIARAYLMEMDVPNHIIDQMFAIPSGEMERISSRDVDRFIDGRTPAYGEWLTARCGNSTRAERRQITEFFFSKIGQCENRVIKARRKEVYRKLISWW